MKEIEAEEEEEEEDKARSNSSQTVLVRAEDNSMVRQTQAGRSNRIGVNSGRGVEINSTRGGGGKQGEAI